MKLDKVANSKNDEYYTPRYAVEPIFDFIPKGSKILCPFDTDNSLFVKVAREREFYVVFKHIDKGENFFDLTKEDVEEFDYIISNPPYSLKTEVLTHLFQLGKPFAMLIGVVGIFESQTRFNLFKNNEFEVLYFNSRIAYMEDYISGTCKAQPPFSSAYFCHKVLPKSMMFVEINKKKVL